jgi:IclR family pca regulon transcriptional regulator
MEPRSTDFVQSLERGLSVIRAFDGEHPELTLSEVAHRTDLTRAAARRFLLTLQQIGYVRSDGKRFALRPRVLELGYAYLSSLGLAEVAMPHLEQLVAEVQMSSSVSVLDGPDIVYVARVMTRRIMSVNINVGTRLPAVSTSMGRVLLAGLDDAELDAFLETAELVPNTPMTLVDRGAVRDAIRAVRETGWALVDQELELGLRSVAAPIRDAQGRTIAAMNVSLPAMAVSAQEVVSRFLEPLQRHAQATEADFGVVDRS